MFVALDRVLSLWRKWTFRNEHFNPSASRFVISKGSCSPSAFARLMSKLAEAGAFIPVYRSVVTRCAAAISLDSPLFHRDSARCSRALKTASCEKQITRPLDIWQTRSNENESARRALCTRCFCTRLVCRRFVSFHDRLLFFSFFRFSKEERDKFFVFESVCRCLSSYQS